MVNLHLERINHQFFLSKLSLNLSKPKYSFFHKSSKKGNIQLLLLKLKINNSEAENLYENLCWK